MFSKFVTTHINWSLFFRDFWWVPLSATLIRDWDWSLGKLAFLASTKQVALAKMVSRWRSCLLKCQLESGASLRIFEMKHLPGTSKRASEQGKAFCEVSRIARLWHRNGSYGEARAVPQGSLLHSRGESLGHLTCISYKWGGQRKMSSKKNRKTSNSVWNFENMWKKFTSSPDFIQFLNQDTFGLRTLHESGRLHLEAVPNIEHGDWTLGRTALWKWWLEKGWWKTWKTCDFTHLKVSLKRENANFQKKMLIEQAIISILTFLHWIPTVGWPAERDVIVSSRPRLIHEKVFKRHLIWYSKNEVFFVEKPPQILMKSMKRVNRNSHDIQGWMAFMLCINSEEESRHSGRKCKIFHVYACCLAGTETTHLTSDCPGNRVSDRNSVDRKSLDLEQALMSNHRDLESFEHCSSNCSALFGTCHQSPMSHGWNWLVWWYHRFTVPHLSVFRIKMNLQNLPLVFATKS